MQTLMENIGIFLKNREKPPLIVILGPTASGKTALSISIAKQFNGEIISADSRQIYRGMDIGTAKILQSEMEGIKHYMIDIRNPDQVFTMADFQREAAYAIKDILNKGKIPVLVGGTGLYINAITENYELDPVPPNQNLRAELEKEMAEHGVEHMYKMLQELDPLSASKIHPNNHRYLLRALEINLTASKPKGNKKGEPIYDIFKIGVDWPREELYERINKRVDEQVARGLLNEIKTLLNKGYSRDLPAMSGLGYKEFFPYLDGEKSIELCAEDLKQATRNYAKRQMTWFGRDPAIYWVSPPSTGY